MEFLKKHYEKVLLSVVLLALAIAAYWLPMAVQQAGAESKVPVAPTRPKSNSVPALDFKTELAALRAMASPTPVSFSGEHRLVNPATWKRMPPDGSVKKFLSMGADALVITTIRPLFTLITYDRAASSGVYINVQQQAKGESKFQEYLKVSEQSKSKLFTIREVKGDVDDPSEVVIELADLHETVSLKKGQPYQKVDDYSADLKYPPENKSFSGKREGELINFGGENHKIVYIGGNEARITEQTGNQITITWTGKP